MVVVVLVALAVVVVALAAVVVVVALAAVVVVVALAVIGCGQPAIRPSAMGQNMATGECVSDV